ncbi:guided entry of tail-anchored proteins factor 1-like isoform X2 [Pollicipes pollicipes]|uniref:guided entry of tail-anchored proteins factor 1-like isoform X2 n=1 Tax=Pollicipes pollicipes TaxID=41117 RepID=UPI0018854EA1|nr:guided entry of tail-anchored proteins factor 1-like isoform X2 [Pollicipes pollicipes]
MGRTLLKYTVEFLEDETVVLDIRLLSWVFGRSGASRFFNLLSNINQKMLIYMIPAIVFLSTISSKIVALIVKLLRPSESCSQAELRRQIRELKARLASLSMVDEFVAYARLERQLNKLQGDFNALASQSRNSELKLRLLITTISHCMTGAAMLYVLYGHGSEPVLQLPATALFPLGYLLAVPGCAPGGVSVASWIIVSNSVVRRAAAALI